MAVVRTVLGDVEAEELGVCNAHDHLFFRSVMLPGQELDDYDAAVQEARLYAEAGGRTIVQWTPHGLGRRAGLLPRLSQESDVKVIAATGLHRAEHYAELPEQDLAELFVQELTEGIGDSQVRAGMIKIASGFHGLDKHTSWVLDAAAEAQRATGAPIGIHHELGTGAGVVLDRLEEHGVAPDRIVLGHLNRFPDHQVHQELAARGAFLAFDGPSRTNHATDWRMVDCLAALVEAGYADQLLLGGDTTTARARLATGEGPGMPYLLTNLRPRLTRRLGEDVVEQIFVTNPARAFATDWK
ncbi:phosphotriesterase family protein [Kribbella sp. DT2]|uniref:phosphotriesterase family protein n=1 Tax=Kribbella sp. DT2 TaxID=3393427 RepID=UPI003CEE138E